MNVTLTDALYNTSRDPRVLALRSITDPAARENAASELNASGVIIDRPIDLWGWGPTETMVYRVQVGLPWVPNAFQPALVDPLNLLGGTHTDMSQRWPRSILVSVDIADYPPHDPAVAAPKRPMVTDVVVNGNEHQVNTDMVADNGKWLFTDGQTFTDPFDSRKWVFHMIPDAWGPRVYATPVAA